MKHKKLSRNYSYREIKFAKIIRSSYFVICATILVFSLILTLIAYYQEKSSFVKAINEFLKNISSNLIASVFTFIAFDVVARRLRKLDAQRGVKIDKFDAEEFLKNVFNAQNTTIRIMDTSTTILNPKFGTRLFIQDLMDAIANSILEKNVEFQVLLLDPEQKDVVEARAKEIGFNAEDFEEHIYFNLLYFQQIQQRLSDKIGKLSIRLYRNSPSLAMYMCHPNLIVTFYRYGQISDKGKQLKLAVNSPVGEFINDRFDEIWNGEISRKLDDFLLLDVSTINSKFKYQVKYIIYQGDYWIQHSKLYQDIANSREILVVSVNDQEFIPEQKRDDELPERVKKLFSLKYLKYGELFLYLKREDEVVIEES